MQDLCPLPSMTRGIYTCHHQRRHKQRVTWLFAMAMPCVNV